MSPQAVARLIGVAILIFVVIIMAASGTYVIEPGYRGVEVTLGKVTPGPKLEGFGFKAPFITAIYPVSIRQQTAQDTTECYSSDLQQIHIELRVLYRVPESSVVKLFQGFYGDPFETLLAPRIHEALKEVTAERSAEAVVKTREQIKTRALDLARQKVGTLMVIEDIVIQNIGLTKQLEQAIEAKMIQEQEAQRSKYLQQRAQIDADTTVIKAKGEAESIRLRGESLRENPAYVDLQIVDKWDGIAPLVIGGPGGSGVLMTVQELEQRRRQNETTTPTQPGVQRSARPSGAR